MLSGPQLRAARNWLDWTRAKLAKESGVSAETIKNIEAGKFRPHTGTQDALINALQSQGIVLTENDGVRKAQSCPKCGWSAFGTTSDN